MEPTIDYSAWKFWFDLAQYLITIAVALYVWISRRDTARKEDMKSVNEAVVCMGDRVTKLETGAVSKDDLGAVYNRINQVGNQVSELTGTVRGIKNSVGMIQEYLLNSGGK